ncbi:hypothetical protein Pint_29024 [Pistacia integerrima]|uniref:Uncharacterized protein n=1 Tax=Pistacia integerrima TaxID=434235 RepID=A0ACC0X0E9_9ROSI|nr:hypothetical protein Pint_29024 [Pistacia integerrima]
MKMSSCKQEYMIDVKWDLLDPEIISRQPTINIGNPFFTQLSSGMWQINFYEGNIDQLERIATMNLAFANAKIYKCENDECPPPLCYKAYGSGKEDSPLCELVGFQNCRMKLLRHVSFVECPDDLKILMPMLITSVPIIQGALLLIDANERFPQKQTSDFLAALKAVGLNHIIILQTKVDSIKESIAMDRLEAIKKFIKRRIVGEAPVLSVSAKCKYNVEDVCEYIVKNIPLPQHLVKRPCVSIFRSVDVNKPAPEIGETKGVVFCGSLRRGVLKVNQMIEIGPGIVDRDENGEIKCTPIYSKIVSLYSEQNELQYAVPAGGLIWIGTTLDPTVTNADSLVGQVLGEVQFLPSLFCKIAVGVQMLEERTKLGRGEIVKLNIHSSSIVARVCQASGEGGIVRLKVKSPVCMMQERFAISRNVENQWRLIAIGYIRGGTTVDGEKIYPPHIRRLGWNL